MKFKHVVAFCAVLFALRASAHPMPHSLLSLDVKSNGIDAELSWPLKELQLVFPNEDLDNGYATLLQRKGSWLDAYLLQHMSIADSSGRAWTVSILGKSVSENEQPLTGKYHELTFRLWLQPTSGASPRHFVMRYDAIMHQLVTHKLFVKITRDWYGGKPTNDSTDVSVLAVNPADNSISAVIVNLDDGSAWKGFKTMVRLGMQHIAEGTDHLLFLFVLLLPATLTVERKRWSTFGGTTYSVIKLVKIATAFTVGHSVSLLLGSLRWVVLPQQPVETAIAVTILITAVHAIRPIFFGKEIYIAVGFGLIHGLAFSTVLSEMNLDGRQMAYSILGFNIGIELMQLFVLLCTMPWLIVLSQYAYYRRLRIGGAVCAIVAALSWIDERVTGHSNFLSTMVQRIADDGKWLVLGLALLAVISRFAIKRNVATD